MLASKEAGGQNNNNTESKADAEVKLEDGDDADNVGNGSLSSSVSSLKRPFQEAVPAGQSIDNNAALSTLQSDAASRPPLDDSGMPLPSWKRPKIEDLHNAAPVSSDHSSTAGSASIYAPSPSATLNMNASPDSGSPASSMVPTPSLQSAILPPNATAGAAMVFGNAPNQQQLRKTSIPPEQIEAAKLGQAQAAVNGLVTGVNPLPLHPHQMQAQYNTAQHGIITQSVPPPMNSTQFGQHHPHPHHHNQANGHPYGYSGYVQQMQHQQQQQQAQPVILPPKTLQQAQAQQRLSSPVTSNPPHSARQGSSDLNANNNKADQRQQSPASNNHNNTAIPYANGRGPARPARTTRSSHSAATAAAQARRGSTAPANEEQNGVKGEEEDVHMYDSSSGGAGAQNTSYNTAATASAGGNKNSSSKKGKKNQASENARAGSAGAGGSNGKKGTASTANANTSVNGTGAGGDPGEDEDEGDDEQKRKAFLERNRQGGCNF